LRAQVGAHRLDRDRRRWQYRALSFRARLGTATRGLTWICPHRTAHANMQRDACAAAPARDGCAMPYGPGTLDRRSLICRRATGRHRDKPTPGFRS